MLNNRSSLANIGKFTERERLFNNFHTDTTMIGYRFGSLASKQISTLSLTQH